MSEVWEIMERHLYFLNHAFGIKIHAFVLMRNHFHIIVSSPNANLSKGMAYFMKATSGDIRLPFHRINQTYGSRFHRSRLDHYNHFMNAYKYLYYNPVKAGAATRVEDYPFSTIRGLLGFEHTLIPLVEDTLLLDQNVEWTLNWLNKTPDNDHLKLVQAALRKKVFSYPRVNRKTNPFQEMVL
jgi:REP element-mobilizing transposase RayT